MKKIYSREDIKVGFQFIENKFAGTYKIIKINDDKTKTTDLLNLKRGTIYTKSLTTQFILENINQGRYKVPFYTKNEKNI